MIRILRAKLVGIRSAKNAQSILFPVVRLGFFGFVGCVFFPTSISSSLWFLGECVCYRMPASAQCRKAGGSTTLGVIVLDRMVRRNHVPNRYTAALPQLSPCRNAECGARYGIINPPFVPLNVPPALLRLQASSYEREFRY